MLELKLQHALRDPSSGGQVDLRGAVHDVLRAWRNLLRFCAVVVRWSSRDAAEHWTRRRDDADELRRRFSLLLMVVPMAAWVLAAAVAGLQRGSVRAE